MPDSTNSAGRPLVGKVRSEQDHADLLTYHLAQIRAAEAEVETAKGPVTVAKAKLSDKQETLTQAFNAAKADLGRGYSREYLGSLLLDGRQKITPLVEFEKMRARDKLALNQPVFGQQPELFPGDETPTAARDEMAWEAEGYLRGLRGALEELQDGDPPAFHQAIMRGYEKGQEETRTRVQRAMELKQREGEPDAQQQAVDLNAQTDALDPDVIEDEADKLKRSGFMETSGAAADESPVEAETEAVAETPAEGFEASPEELAQQKPRLAVVDGRNTSDASSAAA